MDSFDATMMPAVLAACQAAVEQTGRALSRAFNEPLAVAIGEGQVVAGEALLETERGQGLLLVLRVGERAALLVISASTNLLPPWYRRPSATEIGRLGVLAEELGGLLLPRELPIKECTATAVADLSAALKRGELAEQAALLPLTLSRVGGVTAAAHLVWPVLLPSAVADPPSAEAEPAEAAGMESLPPYSRSLLRIQVPVKVTLANRKQTLARIVEIVPGAIVQFDKSCDEMLDLEIGERPVAKGECVKVGDKFGFRITSLILPPERFSAVGR